LAPPISSDGQIVLPPLLYVNQSELANSGSLTSLSSTSATMLLKKLAPSESVRTGSPGVRGVGGTVRSVQSSMKSVGTASTTVKDKVVRDPRTGKGDHSIFYHFRECFVHY